MYLFPKRALRFLIATIKIMNYPIPASEKQRLEALQSLNILDTLPEKDYDDITRLASQICGAPVSLLSFIDTDRQWYKSTHGYEIEVLPREISFCTHAIMTPDEPTIINDMTTDDRFSSNPLVKEDPKVRFYVAVPLVFEGEAIGTICVVDLKPKELESEQVEALKILAGQAMRLLDLRKALAVMKETQRVKEIAYDNLQEFAHIVSHDLKAPIRGIKMLSEALDEDYGKDLDQSGQEYIQLMKSSAEDAIDLVDDILRYSEAIQKLKDSTDDVCVKSILDEVVPKLNAPEHFQFNFGNDLPKFKTSRVAVEQILTNLISNAIKYNDKENPEVKVNCYETGKYIKFEIADNGVGIEEKDLKRIFNLFDRGNRINLNKKNNSHGIGLSIVKKLVEHLDGEIQIESEPGVGTKFEFMIPRSNN